MSEPGIFPTHRGSELGESLVELAELRVDLGMLVAGRYAKFLLQVREQFPGSGVIAGARGKERQARRLERRVSDQVIFGLRSSRIPKKQESVSDLDVHPAALDPERLGLAGPLDRPAMLSCQV